MKILQADKLRLHAVGKESLLSASVWGMCVVVLALPFTTYKTCFVLASSWLWLPHPLCLTFGCVWVPLVPVGSRASRLCLGPRCTQLESKAKDLLFVPLCWEWPFANACLLKRRERFWIVPPAKCQELREESFTCQTCAWNSATGLSIWWQNVFRREKVGRLEVPKMLMINCPVWAGNLSQVMKAGWHSCKKTSGCVIQSMTSCFLFVCFPQMSAFLLTPTISQQIIKNPS